MRSFNSNKTDSQAVLRWTPLPQMLYNWNPVPFGALTDLPFYHCLICQPVSQTQPIKETAPLWFLHRRTLKPGLNSLRNLHAHTQSCHYHPPSIITLLVTETPELQREAQPGTDTNLSDVWWQGARTCTEGMSGLEACFDQIDSRVVLDCHCCVIHDKNSNALVGIKSSLPCLFWQHTCWNVYGHYITELARKAW